MNRKLNDMDRAAILAARTAGMGPLEIARKYNVSRQTINNVLTAMKSGIQNSGNGAVVGEVIDGAGYRNSFKHKSIVAINAGLDDPADNYKRGNLAVNVMKGIGEFGPDQVNQIEVMIANMPADMRRELESGQSFDDFSK